MVVLEYGPTVNIPPFDHYNKESQSSTNGWEAPSTTENRARKRPLLSRRAGASHSWNTCGHIPQQTFYYYVFAVRSRSPFTNSNPLSGVLYSRYFYKFNDFSEEPIDKNASTYNIYDML
jgi:hypothetical protein